MKKIYFKILFTILLILVVNVIISAVLLILYSRRDFDKNTKENLYNQAYIVRDLLGDEIAEHKNIKNIDERIKIISKEIGLRITIIQKNGTVLCDSYDDPLKMDNHLNRPEVQKALSGNIATDKRISPTMKVMMTYLALPVFKNRDVVAVVRVSKQLNPIIHKMHSYIYKSVFYGILIGSFIAALTAFLAAKMFSAPVNKIKDAAENFSNENFDYQLNIKTNDEFGMLASHLNQMAQKLKKSFNSHKQETQKLSAILSGINEELIIIGTDKKIYLANPAFCRLFNVKYSEIHERDFREVIKEKNIADIIDEKIKSESSGLSEIRIFSDAQKSKNYQLHFSPITTEQNIFAGTILIFHDISYVKEMENMRREFVDNASHDLKTPLSAILVVAETLMEREPQDKNIRANFYKTIMESAERLHNLINDLLDLSEIEHKKVCLEFEKCSVSELMNELLYAFAPSIQAKSHTLHLDFPEQIPEISVDKKNLSKAIGNFIDNAIRYTDPGGIISITIDKDNSGIYIKVKDNGIGINESDISRIFERFYRVDKARSVKSGGTGLGLSIAKHIVEAHGGNIKVLSQIGKGSEFVIFLPYKN